MVKVLVIGSVQDNNCACINIAKDAGCFVDSATDAVEAAELQSSGAIYDVIIYFPRPFEEKKVHKIVSEIKSSQPVSKIIVIAGTDISLPVAVESMKSGASEFLTMPCTPEKLETILKGYINKFVCEDELCKIGKSSINLTKEGCCFADIVGQNHMMLKIYEVIKTLHNVDSTVLLYGETGTGKEMVAKAIHSHSVRKNKPFITVNCCAFPETLLESELFGHEMGAFTGAVRKRIGKFEQADKGTIFIDEIGDMSLSAQFKLLRVIQEKKFERLGGEKTISVDVRIIAATNKSLPGLINENRFREDLFYRLNVIPISLPPLKERLDDIPYLVQHFVQQYSKRFNIKIKNVSQDVITLLLKHTWPGNVRELKNVIERAVVMTLGDNISTVEIPGVNGFRGEIDTSDVNLNIPLKELRARVYERYEKEYLKRVLTLKNGKINKVCNYAQIDNKTLYNRMKKYGFDKMDFR